jgi:hypothetical protein
MTHFERKKGWGVRHFCELDLRPLVSAVLRSLCGLLFDSSKPNFRKKTGIFRNPNFDDGRGSKKVLPKERGLRTVQLREGVMRRESVITGLICLNLGLVAGLAYVWKQQRPGRSSSSPLLSTNAQGSDGSRSGGVFTRRIQSTGRVEPASGRFTWRLLESDDFKNYIANLRSVGCPEQTIQDIIIAEVNKVYAGKEAALRLRPEHLKPWETSYASQYGDMERMRKFRQLMNEKRDLLKELLGIDVPQEMPGIWAGRTDSAYEAAYAKLPEGKRDLVRRIQEQLLDKQQELNARTMGFWEPEDQQEMVKMQKEFRDALGQALTKDEMLDYQFATSPMGRGLRSELSAFAASEQELREIFRLRQLREDARMELPTEGYQNNPEAVRKMHQANLQVENEIKAMLGKERYAEYQRSQDWQYRNLTQLARASGLPADAANKAYDMNQLAMQEAARVRSNPNFSREERDAMLMQMQTELDGTMGTLLGPEVYTRFQRNYGGARVFVEQRPAGVVRPVPVQVPTVITVP